PQSHAPQSHAPQSHAPQSHAPQSHSSGHYAPPSAPAGSAPSFASSPAGSSPSFKSAPVGQSLALQGADLHPPAVNPAVANQEMRSAPAAPDLDRLFASDDEPESQDGAVLSAGKVLSQPVDRPSYDPSSDFEDDDDDEETRVLDARELGFTRESRRVDPS